jgi:hypothetical protein
MRATSNRELARHLGVSETAVRRAEKAELEVDPHQLHTVLERHVRDHLHLSSLYSPVGWFSWSDAVEMYEQAQKTPDLMKGFVNTVLGLPFEEEAEAPEWQRLTEQATRHASLD